MKGKIYFIGAGPGDPELLTVKAKRIIERADVIVYADSLINPGICDFAPNAEVHRSASLNLEETSAILLKAAREGKTVARLQSGDPAIYGAIKEQMEILDENGVEYEVIPGVSSVFASAAHLKAELTLPGVSQTVILTRKEGRTPVPEREA
ncbi:MAG: cobalt-precorrin-4/precorrin-4 C(11)-methyltransferase, partial [Chloroflexota bacterium]|nr:cobalt-precorrin-4/precorrin-4 C(11)-methyltransferase [Chloroflexota bacterium]